MYHNASDCLKWVQTTVGFFASWFTQKDASCWQLMQAGWGDGARAAIRA